MEEYEKQSLFPMLFKCHQILHPMVEFGGVVSMYIDEDSNLDIFEMSTKTNEPTKELVNKELDVQKISYGCEEH